LVPQIFDLINEEEGKKEGRGKRRGRREEKMKIRGRESREQRAE
jgi:hypothetical protein